VTDVLEVPALLETFGVETVEEWIRDPECLQAAGFGPAGPLGPNR
jgi:hypothetical protein